MSSSSDPTTILDALERAGDAFEEVGHGVPSYETGIESGGNWKTQLTKACRLLDVIATIEEQNGHYTAVIELCFGAIERSVEAYVIVTSSDTVEDFRDHEYSYERAHEVGLFETETAEMGISTVRTGPRATTEAVARPTGKPKRWRTSLTRSTVS